MIRLLIFFLLLLLGFLFMSDALILNEKSRRKYYIVTVCFILTMHSGLRNWYVGADTYQYYFRFEDVKVSSWNELLDSFIHLSAKDPFYSLFQKFFQVFSSDYQFFLLFVAFIFMSALGQFIYTNTYFIRHVVMAFLIYMANFYLFFSITGIRQTIASAFILFSYNFVQKKKMLLFVLFVLIAGLFHISALIFLIFYLVNNIKKTKMFFCFSILLFPLIFIFKNQLASASRSFGFVEDRFGEYTEQYITGGSLVLTLVHLGLAIVTYFVIDKILLNNPKTAFTLKAFAITMLIFPLTWVNPNIGRIGQYFSVVMMLLVPFVLDAYSINQPKRREVIYLATVLLVVFFTLFSIKVDEYKFFWEEMELPENYRKF